MEWIDNNGHSDFLDTIDKSELVCIAYHDYLYNLVLNGNYLPNTASKYQRTLKTILSSFYSDKIFREITRVAPTILEQRNPVAAPTKNEVDGYLSVLVPFIRNLRKLLMEGVDFPMSINCGDYDVQLLHGEKKNVDSEFVNDGNLPSIWNRKEKRYRSYNEYVNDLESISAHNFDKKISAVMSSSKKNKYSWAQFVVRGYARIFEFVTGAYSSEIVTLMYSNALDVTTNPTKKELVNLKLRAGGLTVKYCIHRKSLMLLREYLKFREWYLDGKECDLLFFNLYSAKIIGDGILNSPTLLRADYASRFHTQLSGRVFDSSMSNISPIKSRKYKSRILKYLGYSPKETANALQHTENTNLASYSKNDEEVVIEELSNYWQAVRSSIKTIPILDPEEKESKSTTVGQCRDYGNPIEIIPTPPIEPKCTRPHGCLFCDQYKVHADKEDVHKLCSLRYVVDSARNSLKEFEAADQLFRELSIRAELVIQEIVLKFPELGEVVIEVKKQVFEYGILTPFWEERLSRYEELGVL
jgi:hypothetical protein